MFLSSFVVYELALSCLKVLKPNSLSLFYVLKCNGFYMNARIMENVFGQTGFNGVNVKTN